MIVQGLIQYLPRLILIPTPIQVVHYDFPFLSRGSLQFFISVQGVTTIFHPCPGGNLVSCHLYRRRYSQNNPELTSFARICHKTGCSSVGGTDISPFSDHRWSTPSTLQQLGTSDVSRKYRQLLVWTFEYCYTAWQVWVIQSVTICHSLKLAGTCTEPGRCSASCSIAILLLAVCYYTSILAKLYITTRKIKTLKM